MCKKCFNCSAYIIVSIQDNTINTFCPMCGTEVRKSILKNVKTVVEKRNQTFWTVSDKGIRISLDEEPNYTFKVESINKTYKIITNDK